MNIQFDSAFDATKGFRMLEKRIRGCQNHSRQRFLIICSFLFLSCLTLSNTDTQI